MIKNNFTPIRTLFHHVLPYFLLFDCFLVFFCLMVCFDCFWYFFARLFVPKGCVQSLDVNTLAIHFTLSTEIEIYFNGDYFNTVC